MDVLIITPAAEGSVSGNRITAKRWAKILTQLGHQVQIQQNYQGTQADILIALHAWRSAASIESFAQDYPNKPLLVALTGTDINYYLHVEAGITLQSLEHADYLIALNNTVVQHIPQCYANKCVTIKQSSAIQRRPKRATHNFNVSVGGHLRTEKDPLRCAYAARTLPSKSSIKIHHYGHAHNTYWAQQARREQAGNRRYHWHGGIEQALWQDKLINSDLMVLSSRNEGGANVISESLAAGCPIVASYIPGNIGLLGDDYPGYFTVGDTPHLSHLLNMAETSQKFYAKLRRVCADLKIQYSPHCEQLSWSKLLQKLS